MFILLCPAEQNNVQQLTDGVTGNTSDFGSEESRFEPWSVNEKSFPAMGSFSFLFCFYK